MVYVICFVIVLWLSFAATYRISSESTIASDRVGFSSDEILFRKLSLIWPVQALLLSVVIGFRFEVGTDWYGYVSIYNDLYGQDLFDKGFAFFKGFEPGFVALNVALNRLGYSYYAIFFVSALITYVFLFSAVAKSAENHVVAIFAIFGLGLIFWHTNHVRQAIAASIVLWGVRYLWEDRLGAYVATVAFATLFHYTAVILIPIGLLCRYRFPKKLTYGAVVFAFAYPFLGGGVQSWINQTLPAFAPETYLTILEKGAEAELGGTGLLRALQFLPIALLVFLARADGGSDKKFNVLMNFSVLYCFLGAVLSGMYGVYRIPIYLGLVAVLFVSCGTNIRLGVAAGGWYRRFVLLIFALSFGVLLARGAHSAVPYRSVLFGI